MWTKTVMPPSPSSDFDSNLWVNARGRSACAPNKIKIGLGPYCPICTPLGYRMHLPRTRIRLGWWQRRTPSANTPSENREGLGFCQKEHEEDASHGSDLCLTPQCQKKKKVQPPPSEECAWNLIGMQTLIKSQTLLPDPVPTEGNTKPLKRHSWPIRRPPQGWPKN